MDSIGATCDDDTQCRGSKCGKNTPQVLCGDSGAICKNNKQYAPGLKCRLELSDDTDKTCRLQILSPAAGLKDISIMDDNNGNYYVKLGNLNDVYKLLFLILLFIFASNV